MGGWGYIYLLTCDQNESQGQHDKLATWHQGDMGPIDSNLKF